MDHTRGHGHGRQEDRQTAIRRALRGVVGDAKFEMWFNRAASIDLHDGQIRIVADAAFIAEWIERVHRDDLHAVAESLLGDREAWTIEVRSPADNDGPDPAVDDDGAAVLKKPRVTSADAHRPPLRQFDDFIVGPSNELAFRAARRLAEDVDGGEISPLFLHGECGVGKTHLLRAIRHAFAERVGARAVRYVTGEQFTNEYLAALRDDSIDQFRARIRRLSLLCIDDVHFMANKSATQYEFLQTMIAIEGTGARVVLASDEHPRHIKQVSQPLVSRFLSGMVAKIDRPDLETRLKLIDRLFDRRGLRATDVAAEMIAAHCVGSVRELQGAITRIAAVQHLMPDQSAEPGVVGAVVVERVLMEAGAQPSTPVQPAVIIDITCETLGVTRSDFCGPGRHRRLVAARGLAALLCRSMTTLSYPEIARAMGRSNHSTVYTAAKRLRGQIDAGERLSLVDGAADVSLRELADQIRHAVMRARRR